MKKTIYNLQFNESLTYQQGHLTYTWIRVPGGWNLTVENATGGITNTFIPQRNEFTEVAREMENKATDMVGLKVLEREKTN
ncbi:MAG: hypothetical protein IKN49_05180 [Elusimicrobiaceae bacterium]|nr:hypothetical protein [Elusimicrobiaceae bacterium]